MALLIQESEQTAQRIARIAIMLLGLTVLILVWLIQARTEAAFWSPVVSYNPPVAARMLGPMTARLTESAQRAERQLPIEDLIIGPGIYSFEGHSYDLRQEGLYRFVAFARENQQRIVYQHDLQALMSSLAWISIHGTDDNRLSPAELTKAAMNRSIVLTCGEVSLWAKAVLLGLGIQSRLAVMTTLDDWNSYDNAHTMIEVLDQGRWKLFDLDGNAIFTGRDGQQLSLQGFIPAVADDSYSEQPIAADPYQATGRFSDDRTKFDLSFIGDFTFTDRRMWMRHVAQVPLIQDPAKPSRYLFADASYTRRMLTYSPSYAVISPAEFATLAGR